MSLSEYEKIRVRKRRQIMKIGRVSYSRLGVFERDNFLCWICGKVVLILTDRNDPSKATIDHVKPVSKGGADTPDNVLTACRSCNELRGNRNYVQLRLF